MEVGTDRKNVACCAVIIFHIPPPRRDLMISHGASSASSLSSFSVTKKRSVDISQRLQAISFPFTDCALNVEGNFFFFFLHLDLNDDGVEDDIQYLNP